MKIGGPRLAVFKQMFAIFFVGLTLVLAVPEIVNFYTSWNPPAPDADKLLRWAWIIPLMSVLGGLLVALFARSDRP